jgi:hypothetical protein
MGVKAVHIEKEILACIILLKPFGGVPEDLGCKIVFFPLTVIGVEKVALDLPDLRVFLVHTIRKRIPHIRGIMGEEVGPPAIPFLTTNPLPGLESPVKIHPGIVVVKNVCHHGGPKTLIEKVLSHGCIVPVHGSPARHVPVLGRALYLDHRPGGQMGPPTVKGKNTPPRHEGVSEGKGGHGLGVGPVETYAFTGEPVQVRCSDPFVSIGPHMVLAERVNNDKDKVHSSNSLIELRVP